MTEDYDHPYPPLGSNVGRAEALGRMALRLEGGLSEEQKKLAREMAAEIFARVLQLQACGPTTLTGYDDVFDLTQTVPFVEWQEKALRNPKNVVHPAHYVLRHMIQMQNTDIVLQAVLGYVYNGRKVMGQALDNLKGVAFEVIKSMGGEITQLVEIDNEGRGWTVFTSAATPDSVVLRRARADRGKAKRERQKLRARQERDLDSRGESDSAEGDGHPADDADDTGPEADATARDERDDRQDR